jgi:uncharacterized protein YkwD
MQGRMAPALKSARFLILGAALLCALLVALTGSTAGAHAAKHHAHHKKNACRAWGSEKPKRLTEPQARAAIACYINRARDRYHLRALDVAKSLNRASQDHTDYMLRHDCFDHECGSEAALDKRLKKAGYLKSGMTAWSYGENIAWGQDRLGTPKAMVKAWMHSPGHRANILNPDFRDVGIGFRSGSLSKRSTNAGLYTTDFGYREFG